MKAGKFFLITLLLVIGFTVSFLSKQENSDLDSLCGDQSCDKNETTTLCPEDCTSPSQVGIQALTTLSDLTLSEEPLAFISIHLEPGTLAMSTDYPEQYWEDLVDLMTLADVYELHLTLSMNPQWATYILQDESRLLLVKNWQEEGHELAYHSHGPHRGGTWNGYTNQSEYRSEKEYLGTVEDAMDLLAQVSIYGQIFSACVSGPEDTALDWPIGVTVRTDGGESSEDLLSTPTQEDQNGQSVWYVTNRQYGIGKDSVSLAEVRAALDSWQQGEVMGLVFHEKNYAEKPEAIEALFQLLQEESVQVEGVSSLVYALTN